MPLTLPWRLAAPAAGIALALTFGLVPAQAGTPGWRVVQRLRVGSRNDVTVGGWGDRLRQEKRDRGRHHEVRALTRAAGHVRRPARAR
jgi:hypothetical protein